MVVANLQVSVSLPALKLPMMDWKDTQPLTWGRAVGREHRRASAALCNALLLRINLKRNSVGLSVKWDVRSLYS